MEQNKIKNYYVLIPVFMIFFVYGFFNTVFGPLASSIISYFSIDTAQAGLILSFLNMGGLVCAFLSIFFAERFNSLFLIAAGMALFIFSIFFIIFSIPYFFALLIFFFCGIGATLFDISGNAVIPEMFSQKKNLFLPLIHIFYGIGTIAGPFIAVLFASANNLSGWKNVYLLICAISFAAFIFYIFFMVKSRRNDFIFKKSSGISLKNNSSMILIFKSKKSWVIFFAAFFYCFFLTGFLSWMPYHLHVYTGASLRYSGIALTLFFTGALAMRFFAPFLLKRSTALKLFLYLNIPAALLIAAGIFVKSVFAALVFFIAGGFLQGISFICLLLIAAQNFPERTAFSSAMIIFAYSIAGFIAPWSIGRAVKSAGTLVPLLAVCLALALSSMVIIFIRTNNNRDQSIIKKNQTAGTL